MTKAGNETTGAKNGYASDERIIARVMRIADPLFEPVESQRELHGIDPRVRRGEAGVGNVFIADNGGKGPAIIVEELESQCSVGEEVYVRGVQRHSMIAEQRATTQLQVRHSA